MKDYNIDLFLNLLPTTITLAYLFFYLFFGTNPLIYKYHQVLKNKNLLIKNIIFTFILCLIGIYRKDAPSLEALYFSPAIFLILLVISNQVIKLVFRRNISIELSGSFNPEGNKKKLLDNIIAVLIIITSFAAPLYLKEILN